MGRLLSTQGDEGHDQHGSSASCDEAPQHEDLSNSALASTGGGTVHQVAPTQHPGLHQALGLQRAGTLPFDSGFDREEEPQVCLLTGGLMGLLGRWFAFQLWERHMCSASEQICALMVLVVF